eukprot:1159699-Pelagomonas_calceolata.AAC.9
MSFRTLSPPPPRTMRNDAAARGNFPFRPQTGTAKRAHLLTSTSEHRCWSAMLSSRNSVLGCWKKAGQVGARPARCLHACKRKLPSLTSTWDHLRTGGQASAIQAAAPPHQARVSAQSAPTAPSDGAGHENPCSRCPSAAPHLQLVSPTDTRTRLSFSYGFPSSGLLQATA